MRVTAVAVLMTAGLLAAAGPAHLVAPNGLALDAQGNLYISDIGAHQIFKLSPAGDLSVVAGAGRAGFSGDRGPAARALLHAPHAIAFDAQGNLYIADTLNHRIRRIDRRGVITTIAGTGVSGYAGDGGPASAALLNAPQALILDAGGSLLVADTYNHVVRRIDRAGTITTFAGKEVGLSGDGGPAREARISLPSDLALAPDGALYIAEGGNSRVRRVAPDGKIQTITGFGIGSGLGGAGYGGNDGPAEKAKLFSPNGLATDLQGNLYVSDTGNNRIRVIRAGTMRAVAGSGQAADLNTPQKIALAGDGRLYVADRGNARVRVVAPSGELHTVAQAFQPAPDAGREALLHFTPPHAGAPATPVAPRTFIDRIVFDGWRRDQIPHAPLSNDYEFCRRVFLDLTGRIPTAEQIRKFVASGDPHKRDALIDDLLASPAWVDHWAYWYADLLRITPNRIGDASTKHFDAWLRRSLADGKPYDRLVTEMLTATAPNSNWTPDAGPAAFLSRNFVAGATMYTDQYEDTADEILVQSARIFLGINYQCISCHGGKGFLEKVDAGLVSKTRQDFWSMAAFFGRTRVRAVWYQDRYTITDDGTGYDTKAPSMVRLQRAGGTIHPAFLLSGEKADPAQPLRPQFARMLTSHPQFARATVNLIWKQLFGAGLVEPVDGFDMARQDPAHPPPAPWTLQPANAALLDALARDFAAGGFRLKPLMRTIAASTVYQLSSRFDGEWKQSYAPHFARRFVRRLTAEQLHDAVCQATGVFGNYRRRDLVYQTRLEPLRFWTEAATPEEIGDREAKTFVAAFGAANREQFDRSADGAIMQALMLMNSPFVTRRVKAQGDTLAARLLRSAKSSVEMVEELYLATLSRPPQPAERDLAVRWLDEDRANVEDLHWALLNKLDFLLNY
jgi:sugar lactone lactonase YvrE